MNKTEFIRLLSKQTNYSFSACKNFVEEYQNLIKNLCLKGEAVRFQGIGKFFLRQRLSRRTFNPQTKRYYYSKNKIFIDFAPSKKIAKER